MKSLLLIAFAVAATTVTGNFIIESPNDTNWGVWGVWERCPFGRYAQALQVKTEAYQGAFTDDAAVTGIRFYCGDPANASTTIISSSVSSWGDWGKVYICRSDDRPVPPDGLITGFQLRVEKPLSVGDDTAANNIRVYCNYPGLGVAEQTKEADGLTFGEWQDNRKCNSNQGICAVETQVEPYFDGG
jgi:hypothetical protein